MPNQADHTPPTTTAPASSAPASKPNVDPQYRRPRPEFVPPPIHYAAKDDPSAPTPEGDPKPADLPQSEPPAP